MPVSAPEKIARLLVDDCAGHGLGPDRRIFVSLRKITHNGKPATAKTYTPRKHTSRRAAYLKDLMELHIKAVSSILVSKERNRDLTLWLIFELNRLILS
jgi:hypothetical protein